MDEVGGVDKKGCVCPSHLVQARFEFGVLKGVLFLLLALLVRPTRHGTDFAHLHTDAPQKARIWVGERRMPVRRSTQLALGHRAWWMGAEVCFECGLMRIECAGLTCKVEVLEAFDALI